MDFQVLDKIANFYRLTVNYVKDLNTFSDDLDYLGSGIRVVEEDGRIIKLGISYTEIDHTIDPLDYENNLCNDIYDLTNLEALLITIHNFNRRLGLQDVRTLKQMDNGIEKLTKLRFLCIYECDFINLPSGLEKLRNLTYLNFAGTPISQIPQEILDLPALSTLIISRSNLSLELIERIKQSLQNKVKVIDNINYRLSNDAIL